MSGPGAAPLSPKHEETLRLVCNTFLPSLEPPLDGDAAFYHASADSQNIMPHWLEAVARSSESERAQLTRLLRSFENRAFIAFLIRRFQPFAKLSQLEREQVLRALSTSRFAQLRQAFQTLKQLSCLLFYAVDNKPDNSVWRTLGYEPGSNSPARAPRLPLTNPVSDTLDCDVCIVGSGAGGGVIAAELAAAGKRVLVLEAGAPLQADDFEQRELAGYHTLYLNRALLTTRDGSIALLAGAALGGGTAVNWQTSLRTPDDVRAEWAEKSGCRFFAEAEFTRSLDAVCARSHVSTAESVVNENNDALRRGCIALGYKWSPIPRNAHGCDLAQCGYCAYGCRAGGKQSTTVTYLRDAVATGNAQVIAGCTVERVNVHNGAVTGVTAQLRPSDGVRQLTVKAPVVVMAAGGIESPAILLRSGIVLPALGRNLFLHPVSALIGVYNQPIRAWSGPPQTIVCDEYAHIDGSYGCRFETVPAHPGIGGNALPWHGAREHRDLMRQFSHAAAILVLSRDHTGGRVWVSRAGRTQLDYSVGARELHYLRTGLGAVARIHVAAGARLVAGLHSKPLIWQAGESVDAFAAELLRAPLDKNASPLFSAHQMGSCRMGTNADAAVCDENGKVFGVRGLYIGDASAFPLSSGVNPMITIMALAHHTARRMKGTAL